MQRRTGRVLDGGFGFVAHLLGRFSVVRRRHTKRDRSDDGLYDEPGPDDDDDDDDGLYDEPGQDDDDDDGR